jgi:hypothetical protein
MKEVMIGRETLTGKGQLVICHTTLTIGHALMTRPFPTRHSWYNLYIHLEPELTNLYHLGSIT